jgi:putative hydrolase of the HAD superfamily
MIKNILFDMGQVLIRFDQKFFIQRLGIEDADMELLLREVYRSVEWVQMDRGTLDEPEAEERMCARLPQRLHGAVHELASRWDQPIVPVAGMEALVRELKQKGYGLWLLSNASRRQHTYWLRCPGSAFFDGTLISADVRLMKPQREIYELCLAHFGLKAEECFFIDDAPANIEGALCCGIPGAVFHGDAGYLRKQLRAVGVDV